MALQAQNGIRFTFRHVVEKIAVGQTRDLLTGELVPKLENRPVTYCYLKTPNEQQYTGEAIVHPNDKFLKERGRKLALARALKESGLGYFDRSQVWAAYHAR